MRILHVPSCFFFSSSYSVSFNSTNLPVFFYICVLVIDFTLTGTQVYRMVLAQSVERPPHNREVVGSIPGRVIPKDVKRWELLLPCLAFNI